MRILVLLLAAVWAAVPAPEQLDGGFTLRASDKSEGRVHLDLHFSDDGNYGRTLDRAEFSDVKPQGDRITFALRRAPGVFTFEGRGTMARAAGWYDFIPDAGFQREMERLGFRETDGKPMFLFALDNLTIDGVRRLQAQVSDPLDTAKVVRLINHGAGPSYVEEMTGLGFRKFSSDEYRRARDHGATPAFIRGLRELGFDGLTLNEYIRLRDHGVTREFVGSMREVGYTKITATELVRLRDHGISANFVRRVTEIFKRSPSVDEIIRFRTRGDIEWAKDK